MVLTEEQRKYQREYKKRHAQRIKDALTPEQLARKKEYARQYREKNKLIIKEKMRIRNQLPEEKKQKKIREWKFRGLLCEDYNLIYDRWFNAITCESCEIKLTHGESDGCKTSTKCMDHDHTTGEFRNIVCHSCNIKRC